MRLARQYPLKPKPLVIDFDGIEGRGIVPGEVDVGLGHAGHQGGARRVDHGDAGDRHRPSAARHARDAIALDQHLAGKQRRARSIEYQYVYEQFLTHRTLHRTDRLRLGGPDELSHSVRWYWHAVDTDTERL